MHLLTSIAAGIRGAGNGEVLIYSRGTSNSAAVYGDFAGKSRIFGTIELDSAGSRELYVNELVDVTVLSASGAEVRSWTDGDSSGAVQIDHSSTTTDVLSDFLDKLVLSAGALDWNVLVGEDEQAVSAALGGSAGVFFTAASFGASGDGTGDDWGPIQAAINAAYVAKGGVVYLAAGTYATSSAISLPTGVSLIGPGSGAVRIVSSSATENVLQTFGTDGVQSVRGITFATSASMSVPLVYMGSTGVLFEFCRFDGTNCASSLVGVSTVDSEGEARFVGCEFLVVEKTSQAIQNLLFVGADSGKVVVSRSRIYAPAESTVAGLIETSNIFLDDVVFDAEAATTGTVTFMSYSGNIFGSVDSSEVTQSSGASVVAIDFGALNNSGSREFAFEDGMLAHNTDANFRPYDMTESASGYYARFKSVEARHSQVIDDDALNGGGAAYPVHDARDYGVFSIKRVNGDTGDKVFFGDMDDQDVYAGVINSSRECVLLYGSGLAKNFTVVNRSVSSALPSWKFKAGSVFAMKLLLCRVYGQSPSGDTTRWHCMGQSSGEPTVDTTTLEAYTF